MRRIYLDNNSTTPMLPGVAEAMLRYQMDHVGNPASTHRRGAETRKVLESARSTIAQCLGAHSDEVVFTSGATEANNLALFGFVKSLMAARNASVGALPALAFSQIEHPSIIEPCKELERRGCELLDIPVDGRGHVQSLPSSLLVSTGTSTPKSIVSIQLANHETGVVQNIPGLRQQVQNLLFHTDATQAVGKIPVNFHELGVNTLACSAHKFHGPCGIGALLVSHCTKLVPRTFGGHQQNSLRPGTEAVALAVGMATALQMAVDQMEIRQNKCRTLRKLFLETLQKQLGPVVINGDSEHGLVNALNLAFPGCTSELLFIRLDLAGIDCSTGSACSSGSLLPSPVLKAMKVPEDVLASSMRFSLSFLMSDEEIIEAAQRIAHEVQALRKAGS